MRVPPPRYHAWERILIAAAALLEREGWCQGAPKISSTRCAVQAIVDADAGRVSREDRAKAIAQLESALGNSGIIAWNDMPGQTMRNVIKTLRRIGGVPHP
jgi:hypothetical protein